MADYTYKFLVTINEQEQVISRIKQNHTDSPAADELAISEVTKEMERKNSKKTVEVAFIKKVRH